MEAHVFNNFFLRWDFTFQVTRAIKLPISARDWHFLVAQFSKNQVHMHFQARSGWQGIGQVWTLLWTETKSTSTKAQKRTRPISMQQSWPNKFGYYGIYYHIWPKTELFLVGQMLEILSGPSYPLREEAGLLSPPVFFPRVFLSPRSTIWTPGTGYTKGHKKIEQWKYILYHANCNAQMVLYNAQMTT